MPKRRTSKASGNPGWFNWYMDRKRIELDGKGSPTKKGIRRLSWRRVF